MVNATPGPLVPGVETPYPLYRRLGEPHGRSVRVRKTSLTPVFESRTVQPVASRQPTAFFEYACSELQNLQQDICLEHAVLRQVSRLQYRLEHRCMSTTLTRSIMF